MGAERESLPGHVAVIMDGNGRWAKKRMLPRSAGHQAGMKRMIKLVDHAFSRGVKIFTLFALSTENLSRPPEELNALFSLFCEYFSSNAKKLCKNGIRLKVIGDLSLLPPKIASLIQEEEKRSEECLKEGEKTLVLAIAYGGRQDILRAVRKAGKFEKPITEEEFSSLLSTGEFPPPDLLIRTGGEMRISNFLLWELAYTELYFSEKMFPAFTNADFDRAMTEYSKRERRYGKV